MAKKNITKGELVDYYNEMIDWRKSKSALALFNDSKIRAFEADNGLRVSAISDEIKALGLKFYQHEILPDGKIEFKYGEDKNVLYAAGESKKTFEDAYYALRSQETVLEY